MTSVPQDLRFGDLVMDDEGYFALVIEPNSPVSPGFASVCFVSNGTMQDLRLAELRVMTFPESDAHANFAECMVQLNVLQAPLRGQT